MLASRQTRDGEHNGEQILCTMLALSAKETSPLLKLARRYIEANTEMIS